MNLKRFLRKLRFWRKPQRSQYAPLWRTLQANVYSGPILSRSEWASVLRTIASEMDNQIVEDAGPSIGIWYKENPVDWLRREAARAQSTL